MHVLADALTSVLAIAALLLGRSYGWYWADPVMGVVGAIVITRWSWGLIRDTSGVLLDRMPHRGDLEGRIRSALGRDSDVITDLHIWQVGPGHHSVILSIASKTPLLPRDYKEMLKGIDSIAHITVEVHPLTKVA